MSGFKGTPGPWHYIGTTLGEDSGWFVRVAPHRHVSAEGRNGKEAEANARLIAAAPDLLDALVALFNDYKRLADSGDAGFWSLEDLPEGKQALAAIAKATGEQP